ncbi:MBL fold metallo-hydrolase [Pseudodesulfovibrio cashew]|uniref:MBL fold metallo-hydrolase n=1 Tax=Pseudodesulfovibrio cashew TaxID=2678688 RepID=A0A6I6JFI5_9BACT|nr:MBL fold metallo-hydrolase [Pseudodesulfovibrio cashew]QGY39939.1 MBL fold metallo-hydrolase [Pseudodesulfovibrio cashew]
MQHTRDTLLAEWIETVINSQQFYPYDTTGRAQQVASLLETATKKGWKDWKRYLEVQEDFEKKDTYIKRLWEFYRWAVERKTPVEPWLVAHALYQLVAASSSIDDADTAEECLEKLLDSFKDSGDLRIQSFIPRALNNMGVMYGRLKNVTKAYGCLNQVINDFKQFDDINITIAVATARLNIGIISGDIEDKAEPDHYLKLIKAYRGSDNKWLQEIVAEAMFNMGHCRLDFGEYEKAIAQWEDIYHRFKDNPSQEVQVTVAEALNNIGLAFNEMDEPDREIEAYNRVLETFEDSADANIQEQVSLARRYKRLILRDMGMEAESQQVLEDAIETARATENQQVQRITLRESLAGVIDRFSNEKENFLSKMDRRKKKIDAFLEKHSRFKHRASLVFVLRQWNSFTPIIADGTESDRGGGYFIYHNRMGIVVDPGYDFIEHFHKIGGRIHDITHIVITHAHDDHTAQLEQLLTMFHQYNKKGKKKKVFLLLNHSTLKKFSGFRLHKDCEYIDRVICLNSYDPTSEQTIHLSSQCSLTVLPAYHDDVFTEDYAVGLGFKFKFQGRRTRKIVFTGDTGLFPPKQDLDNKIEKFDKPPYEGITKVREDEPSLALHKNYPEEFGKSPDLFIPHIGSIQRYEFDPSRNPDEPMFYANHLGLLGTATMIHELDPASTIVSEFGSELKDLRMQIAEFLALGLQRMQGSENRKFIIPGDTSIVYNIETSQFLRHDDCAFHSKEEIAAKEVEGKRIGLFQPDALSFSLEPLDYTLRHYRGEQPDADPCCRLPYFKDE